MPALAVWVETVTLVLVRVLYLTTVESLIQLCRLVTRRAKGLVRQVQSCLARVQSILSEA